MACVAPFIRPFLDERKNLYPTDGVMHDTCSNFVDYQDNGDFGLYVFRLEKIHDLAETFIHKQYYVSLTASSMYTVNVKTFGVTAENLNDYVLQINRKNPTIGEFYAFEEMIDEDDIARQIKSFELFARHFRLMSSAPNLFRKMFPHDLISNLEELDTWTEGANKLMKQDVPSMMALTAEKLLKIKKGKITFSDFLIGCFLKRFEGKRYDGVNTRLMLFAISCLILADDTERIHLLSSIYSWIALRTCDSCLEKIFRDYVPTKADRFKNLDYEYSNFSAVSTRFFEFNIDFQYRIYDCRFDDDEIEGNYMPVAVSVIPIYSHSALIIKNQYSAVDVKVNNVIVRIGFYAGVSLYRAINLVTKTIKEMHFTKNPDALLARMIKMNELVENNGYKRNFFNEMIFDISVLFFQCSPLQNLAKRVIFFLYYATIPLKVMRLYWINNDDYYTAALCAIMNVDWYEFEIPDFNRLFLHGMDRGYMETILNSTTRLSIFNKQEQ